MSELFDAAIHRRIGPKVFVRKTGEYEAEQLAFKDWFMTKLVFTTPLQYLWDSHLVRTHIALLRREAGREEYDSSTVDQIPKFIEMMNIDMSQFKKENINDYESFNDFFIREIKPEARPIAAPDDDSVVLAPADCRLTVFDSVADAKHLMIKGKKFDMEHLLGGREKHADLIDKYANAVMLNARLAPQDYHRYHAPLKGTVTQIYKLDGTDFFTRRESLQSSVNVLTENEREIIEVESENCSYCFVPIGANEVGATVTLIKKGDKMNKGDEIGYFQYGGSDIVVLFSCSVEWDRDLHEKSYEGMETLVQVNEAIGKLKCSR